MAGDAEFENVINRFAFLDADDGAAIEYEGPFEFRRDAGSFEVDIPTDPDDYAGIHEGTAENLTERDGDFGVALADAGIEASGVIEAADVIEGKLTIRVDDGAYADPSELDIDLSEVDR